MVVGEVSAVLHWAPVTTAILIRAGYPPVAIRPEDRLEYIRSLQEEQAGTGAERFIELLYRRVEETLDEYLATLATKPA